MTEEQFHNRNRKFAVIAMWIFIPIMVITAWYLFNSERSTAITLIIVAAVYTFLLIYSYYLIHQEKKEKP